MKFIRKNPIKLNTIAKDYKESAKANRDYFALASGNS